MKGVSSNTSDYLNKKNNIKKLQQMQEVVNYQRPIAVDQETEADKNLLWFSRLLGRIDESGDSLMKVRDNLDSTDTAHLHGFHFGSLALAGFDFARIPLIYLIAYILNKKVPVNLNNNARWLYSGVLLGLAIAAFAAPPIAPIIAFVTAGVGFCTSVFLLGKTLYQRYNLGRERKEIHSQLAYEEREMLLIQQEVSGLERHLEKAEDEQYVIAIYQEMAGLIERYEQQKIKIQELKNKAIVIEERLSEVDTTRVAGKSISLIVASLAVIGLIVSVLFPPAGLGIIAGAAIAGAAYFAARLAIPLFKSLGHWIAAQFKSSPEAEKEGVSESSELNNELSEQPYHESTTDVMCGLMAKTEAIQTLQAEHDSAVWEEGDPASKVPQMEVVTVPMEGEDTDDDGERERQGEHYRNTKN